jgi:hypothetical protein
MEAKVLQPLGREEGGRQEGPSDLVEVPAGTQSVTSPPTMSANRMTQMGYTLGLVAIFATFAPPALFAAPLLGLLAIAFGVIGLKGDRWTSKRIDRAVVGIVLGAASIANSLPLIWVSRHVIAGVLHGVTPATWGGGS